MEGDLKLGGEVEGDHDEDDIEGFQVEAMTADGFSVGK